MLPKLSSPVVNKREANTQSFRFVVAKKRCMLHGVVAVCVMGLIASLTLVDKPTIFILSLLN